MARGRPGGAGTDHWPVRAVRHGARQRLPRSTATQPPASPVLPAVGLPCATVPRPTPTPQGTPARPATLRAICPRKTRVFGHSFFAFGFAFSGGAAMLRADRTRCSARACCADRVGEGRGFVIRDDAVMPFRHAGPIVEADIASPEPDPVMARHEAGHVAVAIALGARAETATLGPPAHARIDDAGLPLSDRIAIRLAGPTAERWHYRHVFITPDEIWVPWIGMARELRGGSCDECQACRLALVAVRHAENAVVIAALRRAEARTLDLIRDPPIWRAIRATAAALIEHGTLREEAITAICAEHFEAGAYRTEIPHA